MIPRYSLNRKLGGTQTRAGRHGEETYLLLLPVSEPRFFQSVSQSLYCVHYPGCYFSCHLFHTELELVPWLFHIPLPACVFHFWAIQSPTNFMKSLICFTSSIKIRTKNSTFSHFLPWLPRYTSSSYLKKNRSHLCCWTCSFFLLTDPIMFWQSFVAHASDWKKSLERKEIYI
jgi:hypothetical protein